MQAFTKSIRQLKVETKVAIGWQCRSEGNHAVKMGATELPPVWIEQCEAAGELLVAVNAMWEFRDEGSI
jgi:hypothetical protein